MSTVNALISLLLVSAAWIYYLVRIPQEKVPRRPHGTLIVMGLASGLALASLPKGDAPWLLWSVLTVLSVGLSVFFVYLLRQAPLPDKPIAVAVGDALPEFVARNDLGDAVRSKDWKGKRILLKFFRGHW